MRLAPSAFLAAALTIGGCRTVSTDSVLAVLNAPSGLLSISIEARGME